MAANWEGYTGPMRPTTFTRQAPFGWTATEKGGREGAWVVYKRDCPEYLDNVPVFRTRKKAREAIEELREVRDIWCGNPHHDPAKHCSHNRDGCCTCGQCSECNGYDLPTGTGTNRYGG